MLYYKLHHSFYIVLKSSIIQFKWVWHKISIPLLQNTRESKHFISELRSSFPLNIQVLRPRATCRCCGSRYSQPRGFYYFFFLFHLCLARRAQPFLSHVVSAQVIHTFLTRRLHYSNALRVRLHLESIWHLN